MMTLIAVALAAAAPEPADAHMQHQQMAQMQPGEMGDMKPGKKDDCCCKDMKAKMDGKHAGHDDQPR